MFTCTAAVLARMRAGSPRYEDDLHVRDSSVRTSEAADLAVLLRLQLSEQCQTDCQKVAESAAVPPDAISIFDQMGNLIAADEQETVSRETPGVQGRRPLLASDF